MTFITWRQGGRPTYIRRGSPYLHFNLKEECLNRAAQLRCCDVHGIGFSGFQERKCQVGLGWWSFPEEVVIMPFCRSLQRQAQV